MWVVVYSRFRWRNSTPSRDSCIRRSSAFNSGFNRENATQLDMRIGINSGPVVAGVIGFTKFSYDLWGSAVNIASRMESTSQSGKIQISPSTYESLQGAFSTSDAGTVECKGIGPVKTHFLVGRD